MAEDEKARKMADLTESEKKMLRELAAKHGYAYASGVAHSGAVALLSELLLAMKERAAGTCESLAGDYPSSRQATGKECGRRIREADFGDLFKEKV